MFDHTYIKLKHQIHGISNILLGHFKSKFYIYTYVTLKGV